MGSRPLDDSAQQLLEMSQPGCVVGTIPEQLHVRRRRRKCSTVNVYVVLFSLFEYASMFCVSTKVPCAPF